MVSGLKRFKEERFFNDLQEKVRTGVENDTDRMEAPSEKNEKAKRKVHDELAFMKERKWNEPLKVGSNRTVSSQHWVWSRIRDSLPTTFVDAEGS